MAELLPHRVAVLCTLFNDAGQMLLLYRRKPPNQELYSPVGGKLDHRSGESPPSCAVREIHEETGLSLAPVDLHLTGLVSESAYAGETHWLMFLYEVTRPVQVGRTDIAEGRLGWYDVAAIGDLNLPMTDRYVIWPLFWRYRHRFFAVHIDCRDDSIHWRLEQPHADAGEVGFVAGGD